MMTHEESYLTRLIDRLLLEPSAVTEIGLRKLHKEAADMLHLLSAAPQTAAVQPQEPVAVDATEQRRALLVGECDWSEVAREPAAGVTAAHPLHMPTDEQFRFMRVPQHENYACEKAAIRLFCRLNGITRRLNAQCTAASAECAATQRHITDMLVAHRDMIEAQQRGDGEAEVLAVRRMEAARSAVAGASPCRPRQTDTGEEQLEPFWCHEQSHDRPRCETQCSECAEDGTAGESMDGQPMPSLDEMMAVVRLYGKHPTPHNEFKVRCALRDQALGGPHMENPAEVDPSGYKVKLPYTEAIRKADTDGEFTYSTDQDFSDPEKYGWERVYGVDHMIEYGNACARAALVALGRNAGVRMSVLRGKACTCGALGTGSAAGRTTAEFSSLRTQAHGYGVPGTHEGEQHG
jgi:hypothetical protein